MRRWYHRAWAKFVVGTLAVTTLVAGGLVFGPQTQPAQAWTQSCRYVDAGAGRIIAGSPWPGYRYAALCYIDYNWWEEVSFPWPKDKYVWNAWSNQYCAYPARLYVGQCAGF